MLYEQGDILIVELKTGDVYDGILYAESLERISLCSTVEYPSGKLFENVCDFSKKEIETIRLIKDEVENSDQQINCTLLNIKEYKHLTNLINSFKFINQMDIRFFDAVKKLEAAESIGIDAKGCQVGRFYRISYLVMSVWDQVYVFDMKNLELFAFDSGLKNIFENEFILKVCHNSQKLNDCLVHNYNVKIKNVFDILLADYTLQERSKISNPRHLCLDECVMKYLCLPASFLDKLSDNEWTKRPLPMNYQQMIAGRCSFLLILKNILQKEMNKSINKIIDIIYCMTTDTLNPSREEINFPNRLLQIL